jgi:hypothetical protein
MRATEALEKLAEQIETAHERKLVPTAEALASWRELVQVVKAEAVEEWMTEPLFRLRTGAAARWCRVHFAKYEKLALAKRDPKGRRIWHIAVRPMKRRLDSDPAAIRAAIADSFRKTA